MSRPEYVKCVVKDDKEYWCGRINYNIEWAFINIDHALITIGNEERLKPCSRCLENALLSILNNK